MKVIVTMKAPMRVVFDRRGDLGQLMQREPDNELPSIRVMVSQKFGNEWTVFEARQWRFLNRSHVAHVEEFTPAPTSVGTPMHKPPQPTAVDPAAEQAQVA